MVVRGKGRMIYFFDCDFLGRRFAWMFGRTPPPAMATEPRSLLRSSSLRTASWMWRGMMRVFLLSRAAGELEDLGAELEDGAHVDARGHGGRGAHRAWCRAARGARTGIPPWPPSDMTAADLVPLPRPPFPCQREVCRLRGAAYYILYRLLDILSRPV